MVASQALVASFAFDSLAEMGLWYRRSWERCVHPLAGRVMKAQGSRVISVRVIRAVVKVCRNAHTCFTRVVLTSSLSGGPIHFSGLGGVRKAWLFCCESVMVWSEGGFPLPGAMRFGLRILEQGTCEGEALE